MKDIDSLIKICDKNEKNELINAKYIYEELQITMNFLSWIKSKIKEYGYIESIDYLVDTLNNKI